MHEGASESRRVDVVVAVVCAQRCGDVYVRRAAQQSMQELKDGVVLVLRMMTLGIPLRLFAVISLLCWLRCAGANIEVGDAQGV